LTNSNLDRFINAVEDDDRAVFVGPNACGRRLLAEYRGLRFDPPLMLDFSEEEFEATVRTAGPGARSLWPEVPEAEAGVRLLLVHLYESLCGMQTPVRRVYLSEGQVWAE
jgi:hypothetical protein